MDDRRVRGWLLAVEDGLTPDAVGEAVLDLRSKRTRSAHCSSKQSQPSEPLPGASSGIWQVAPVDVYTGWMGALVSEYVVKPHR